MTARSEYTSSPGAAPRLVRSRRLLLALALLSGSASAQDDDIFSTPGFGGRTGSAEDVPFAEPAASGQRSTRSALDRGGSNPQSASQGRPAPGAQDVPFAETTGKPEPEAKLGVPLAAPAEGKPAAVAPAKEPDERKGRRRRGRDRKDQPTTPPNLATTAESEGPGAPEPDGPEIARIEVLGNRLISRDVILLSLTLRPGDKISDSKVDKELENLKELGYFAYIEPEVLPAEEGKVNLLFKVIENPVVREVRVEGATLIPLEELRQQVVVEPGNVLNSTQLRESISRINNAYQEKDYAFCGILTSNQFDMDRNTGILVLKVAEPVLGEIRITGNTKTRSFVLLREFETKKGRVLQAAKLRRSLRNLYRLQYFEEVKPPRPQLSEDLSIIDLELEVKEQRTGQASAGGGYSTVNGLIGFIDVAERNFRGRGQTMRVKWEFGGQRSYQLDFVEPWFRGKPRSLGLSLFNTRVNRFQFNRTVTSSIYEERRGGFAVSSSRRIAKDTRITTSFSNEKVTAQVAAGNVLPADLALRDPDGDGRVEYDQQFLTLGWVKDARDNPFAASEGYRYSATVTTTGGLLAGPTGFNRYLFDLRRYFPIGRDGDAKKKKRAEEDTGGELSPWTIATRLKYGFHSVFDGSLTFNDRFALGGGDSLRGYQDREFTGSRFGMANLEIRRNLSKVVSLVAFYDLGDAWGLDGFDMDLKAGVGFGLRFNTPIGPFRLDYGKGETDSRFHFGIGQQF